MAADDRRPPGEVAEGDRADDALGLADDVVVHHMEYVAVPLRRVSIWPRA